MKLNPTHVLLLPAYMLLSWCSVMSLSSCFHILGTKTSSTLLPRTISQSLQAINQRLHFHIVLIILKSKLTDSKLSYLD